jgi:hypothetical protein
MRRILIALLVSAAFPAVAAAQRTPTPRPAPQATPTICDPLDLLPGCRPASGKPVTLDSAMSGINVELQKVTKQIVDAAVTDVTAALTDAKNRNDLISQPCWESNLAFLQLLPIEWQSPPETVGPALAFQIGRDLITALTGSDPKSMKVACAAMWGDTASIATNALALIGIKALIPGL